MKAKWDHFFQFRNMLLGILSLCNYSVSAATCGPTTMQKDATVDDAKSFFARKAKKVVTFVGYSGLDYEDKTGMLEQAGKILNKFDTANSIVNIGATVDGIGAVYELAKQRGFVTSGIVSNQAKEYQAELSPCVDYVFYIEDPTWGGFVEGSDQLSPTSTAMVEVSDVMIGIGGGEVARDELRVARRLGKDVHFISADMNHQRARDKAEKKGLPEPSDFAGAASKLF